jgi:hypothetical protein
MAPSLTRRHVLRAAAASAAGPWISARAWTAPGSPNDKLNVAVIGVSGRGGSNFGAMRGQNVVALCDVDERNLGKAKERAPEAKTFVDFRKMLDEMSSRIDAVTVSTPDHVHGPACIAALQLGKHVYVEKPMAHNVYECYKMAELARTKNVVTQLGNQHHADWHYHRAAELVKAGVIGKVTEVHCNHLKLSDTLFPKPAGGPILLAESGRPKDTPPAPEGLHWDLWLGPAPERPYHSSYCPFNWRGWWDFGTGGIGDFVCHFMDPAFMTLDLKFPISAEAVAKPAPFERIPSPTVRYVYPARGDQPPVTVYWHTGESGPPAELLDGETGTCLIVGEKGCVLCRHAKAAGDEPLLLPKKKFADFQRPKTQVVKRFSHHGDWLNAIKTGGKSGCDFANYGVALGVAAVLWQAAFKVGRKIEWDGETMKVTNVPEANAHLRRTYRKGWEL